MSLLTKAALVICKCFIWFSGFYQRIGFSDAVVYASLYFNRMLVEHGILALYIGIDNLYGQE